MQYNDITPRLSADEETIAGITYKTTCDSVINGNIAKGALYTGNDCTEFWQSDNTALPHYWQIYYSVPVALKQFLFRAMDDLASQILKDYELHCSNDGLTYIKVASGICVNEGAVGNNHHSINTVTLDNPVKTQYVKLVILDTYDTRGYKWAGMWGVRLIGRLIRNDKLYVSNTAVYGMKESV